MAQKTLTLDAAPYGPHYPIVWKKVTLCKNLKEEEDIGMEVAATADCVKFFIKDLGFLDSFVFNTCL